MLGIKARPVFTSPLQTLMRSDAPQHRVSNHGDGLKCAAVLRDARCAAPQDEAGLLRAGPGAGAGLSLHHRSASKRRGAMAPLPPAAAHDPPPSLPGPVDPHAPSA